MPLPRISSVNLSLFAALSALAGGTFAQNFEWIGIVNASGSPQKSPAAGSYENINIHATGASPAIWSDTTEAAIIKGGKTIAATGNVSIVNSVQHNKVDNNGALYVSEGSTVDFNGGQIYIAAIGGHEGRNDSTAISAKTPGFGKNQGNTVNVSGETVQLIGSLDVSSFLGNGSNAINVTLNGSNSFWYGSAIGEFGKNTVNVNLENGATWIYNPSSSWLNTGGQLKQLTLNNGNILLADDLIWERYESTIIRGTDLKLSEYRDREKHYTGVDIKNLSGKGGNFIIDLDWESNLGKQKAGETSDFITIGKAEDNSAQKVFFDSSKANLGEMKHGDKLYFASVAEGNTTFSTNIDGQIFFAADELFDSQFVTECELSEDNNGKTFWYLTKKLGKTNQNVASLGKTGRISYAALSSLSRFNDRIAEPDDLTAKDKGAWVRIMRRDSGFAEAFDLKSDLVQVGYNAGLANDGLIQMIGVSFDYDKSDADLKGIVGKGDLERFGINFYVTRMNDSGGYVDTTLKAGRLRSQYDLFNVIGDAIGSSLHQDYTGLAVEAGRRITFNEQYYLEPQFQLQYLKIQGDTFFTKSGIEAKIHSIDSLIGRIGIRTGYRFKSVDGSLFAYADVLREFDGKYSYLAQGKSTTYGDSLSGRETWFDLGIGTNTALSDSVNWWLDSRFVTEGDWKDTWIINTGLRVRF